MLKINCGFIQGNGRTLDYPEEKQHFSLTCIQCHMAGPQFSCNDRADCSMGITPPFLCSCALQWILKQGKGCFAELGLVKRRVSLFTVWLTCSEENLWLLSATSFFWKTKVCSPKTSVDVLRAVKLTLTRQFTGFSLRTWPGTNYKTAARVLFALSPSNLPPCQWSLTKKAALGIQQTLLIALVGCQQNCFKSQWSL